MEIETVSRNVSLSGIICYNILRSRENGAGNFPLLCIQLRSYRGQDLLILNVHIFYLFCTQSSTCISQFPRIYLNRDYTQNNIFLVFPAPAPALIWSFLINTLVSSCLLSHDPLTRNNTHPGTESSYISLHSPENLMSKKRFSRNF